MTRSSLCYIICCCFLIGSCANQGPMRKPSERAFIDVIQDSLDCFIHHVGPVFRDNNPKEYYSVHVCLDEAKDTIILFYTDFATSYSIGEEKNVVFLNNKNSIIQLSSTDISFSFLLRRSPLRIPSSEINLLYDDLGEYRKYSMRQYRYLSGLDSLVLLKRRIGGLEAHYPLYAKWVHDLRQCRLSKKQQLQFANEYRLFVKEEGNPFFYSYLNCLGQRIIAKNRLRYNTVFGNKKENDLEFFNRISTTLLIDDVPPLLELFFDNYSNDWNHRFLSTDIYYLKHVLDLYPDFFFRCYSQYKEPKKGIIDWYIKAIPIEERESFLNKMEHLLTWKLKDKKRIMSVLRDSSI